MVSDSDCENTPLEYLSSESGVYTENEEHKGTICNDPIPFTLEILDIMEQHGLTLEDLETPLQVMRMNLVIQHEQD